MLQEIKRTNTQIMFDGDEFAQWNIPLRIIEDSNSQEQEGVAKEDQLDAQDAVQLITDELDKAFWRVLEV